MSTKRDRLHPFKIVISPEMIAAGTAAYERWCRFADAPLEGKNRNRLTSREMARLTDEAMVAEIVRAMFRNRSA